MNLVRIVACLVAFGSVPAALLVDRAVAATVLMISVDGLKPEYVTEADQRGLKVPVLRSLMADGAYADGVAGVWPTNTYPSHTTLVTGVAPASPPPASAGRQRSAAPTWTFSSPSIGASSTPPKT